MTVTLIKPSIGRSNGETYSDEGRMEPLQLGVLAALTPPEAEVVMYDDRIEEIPYDAPTQLAAITVETYTARRAYEISAEYRRRGVPVIMGGVHATLHPKECASHADSVYLGDAESGWTQAVHDALRGRLKPSYRGGITPPQTGFLPRRDIFAGKGYLPFSLMQFSRGCLFACNFCAVGAYFRCSHLVRPVREVIEEVENRDRRFVFFVDDNISCDREALKRLCRELIPLGVKWISQGSLDMTQDRELMDLMARSGCLGLVVGFESLDPQALRWMKKSPNLPGFESYGKQVRIFREHGLQIWAAFVLGHDYETRHSIENALEFAIANKFSFAAFNILTPYPGTPLYRDLEAQGRLLYDGAWWLHPDYRFNHASFVPKLMSPDELTEGCYWARRKFSSFPSILRRALDFNTNLRNPFRFALYARNNLLIRQENERKQGMKFGRLS